MLFRRENVGSAIRKKQFMKKRRNNFGSAALSRDISWVLNPARANEFGSVLGSYGRIRWEFDSPAPPSL